jgi:hypothetical protein
LVLAAGTLFLWLATKRLVRGSEKTAERQLRAYVLVSSARVHDFGIERPPKVEVVIKNSGQTPAFDLSDGGGKLEPLASFTTNPAGSQIVNAVGPIRQIVLGETDASRHYLVIVPGSVTQLGKPVQVQLE